MPTNRKRRTRKARPAFTPLQLAMLTGGPLPESFGPFEALQFHDCYLNDATTTGFRAVWRRFHGHDMTDTERAAVVARVPEIEARLSLRRTIATTPAASGGPTNAGDEFKPIARLSDDE